MRFEAPEFKNRWDSTLFTVSENNGLPLEEIANVLLSQKAPPPNKSTLNVLFICLTLPKNGSG